MYVQFVCFLSIGFGFCCSLSLSLSLSLSPLSLSLSVRVCVCVCVALAFRFTHSFFLLPLCLSFVPFLLVANTNIDLLHLLSSADVYEVSFSTFELSDSRQTCLNYQHISEINGFLSHIHSLIQ